MAPGTLRTTFDLRGVGVVNATPTRADGSIDEAEYRRHVRWLADAGVAFIQPAAATGQALTLTEAEHRQILEWSVDEVGDRVAVTAYSGRDGTAETVRLTKMAKEIGCAYAYIIQPYFSRPDHEGLLRHYATVAESVDMPIVIYNNPDRAGVPVPISVMARLSERYDNIVGLKQSDLNAFADSVRALSPRMHVMPKSEKEALFGLALGSRAILGFSGNVIPSELVEIHRRWEAGDLAGAREVYLRFLPLMNAVHIEPVPGAVKWMLNAMGWSFGAPRLPGHELSDAHAREVDELLVSLGKAPAVREKGRASAATAAS
ncbi:MAG: dihydrodipicolinate synthase family protein [Candidatus Limnocylindria bacterium]